MAFTEEIKIWLIRKNVSHSELATRLGISSQNLSNKMKRDDFKISEIKEIADALGMEFAWSVKEKE